MAGIEKVCEYSGEYPGHPMYGYKKNLIQVMPEYRKLFKKQPHVLVIFKPKILQGERNKYTCFGGYELKRINKKWCVESRKWVYKNGNPYYEPTKVVHFYDYCLYVPGLKGEVAGYYWNHSTDISSVKRKIKNLLKVKNVNIVKVDEDADLLDNADELIKSLYESQ